MYVYIALGVCVALILTIVARWTASYMFPKQNPIVSMYATPNDDGYWLLDSKGQLYPFGNASQHRFRTARKALCFEKRFCVAQIWREGSLEPLQAPIVGALRTEAGNGTWLFAEDGGVFCFNDAPFYGSLGLEPKSYGITWKRWVPDQRIPILTDDMYNAYHLVALH